MGTYQEDLAKMLSVEAYSDYDYAVTEYLYRSKTLPHCDQFILHPKGVCEYCDKCEELHEARKLLKINHTGEYNPTKLTCPAEVLRGRVTMEKWGGNVPETPERKAERKKFFEELNHDLKIEFPNVDWDEDE